MTSNETSSWDECRRLANALNFQLANASIELNVRDGCHPAGKHLHWVAFAVCRLRPYDRLYDLITGWGPDRESASADLLRRFAERPEWEVNVLSPTRAIRFRSASSAEEVLIRWAAEGKAG